MKRVIYVLAAVLLLSTTTGYAQKKGKKAKKEEEKGYVFTAVKDNPATSVKDQNRSGTCWSYSALSFIESEVIKAGKGEEQETL